MLPTASKPSSAVPTSVSIPTRPRRPRPLNELGPDVLVGRASGAVDRARSLAWRVEEDRCGSHTPRSGALIQQRLIRQLGGAGDGNRTRTVSLGIGRMARSRRFFRRARWSFWAWSGLV